MHSALHSPSDPPPPLHPQLVGSGYHSLTTRRGFVSSYTIVATSSAAVHLVPHRSWQLLARKHAKFPKAAFKKLTSRAAWHSPGSREAVLSSIDGGSASMTASIAASQALPNAWDVNMSKSLADLNRWLSSAVPADIAEFLTPSMAKDAVGGDVDAVEGDVDAEAVGLTRGQYFASPETAATISGRLEAHLAALPRGAEVALVEPSCGTGALLLGETGALAALTRWSASGGGDVSLVCCVDIDSAVLSYCNSGEKRRGPMLLCDRIPLFSSLSHLSRLSRSGLPRLPHPALVLQPRQLPRDGPLLGPPPVFDARVGLRPTLWHPWRQGSRVTFRVIPSLPFPLPRPPHPSREVGPPRGPARGVRGGGSGQGRRVRREGREDGEAAERHHRSQTQEIK